MKKIFTLIALMVSICSFGAKLNVSLDDLGSGWSSSYDAATKTITYESAWSGRGWWIGNQDYSAFDKFVLKFEPTSEIGTVQVIAEYYEEDGSTKASVSSTQAVAGTAGEVELLLDKDYAKRLMQVYIQADVAGTLTLIEAYFESVESGESAVIWEGETTFDSWGANVSLPAAKFVGLTVDDKIVFTLSELFDVKFEDGSEWNYGGQVLFKKSDWSDLLSTSHVAITTECPCEAILTLTEEAVTEATTNGIILQGMGCTLTKVTIQKASSPTSIEGVANNEAIVSTEYFNAAGQRIAAPQKGLVIKKSKTVNGNSVVRKFIVK